MTSDEDRVLIVPDRIVLEQAGSSPTVEVRVWRGSTLVSRELVEDAAAAQAVVEHWSEIEGVECEVDDLAVRHRPDAILDPSPDMAIDPDER